MALAVSSSSPKLIQRACGAGMLIQHTVTLGIRQLLA